MAGPYEQTRPDWPAPTVSWLTGTAPDDDLGAGTLDVLDLGAGTGKLTTALLTAGHRVIAVEPSASMLGQLARVAPGARAVRGAAEGLPLDDACVDVVTVAQAWHWFDAERAAAECHRVLRSGGLLALAWHARDERVGWVAELSALAGRPPHVVAQNQASQNQASQNQAGQNGAAPEVDVASAHLSALQAGFGPVAFREFGYEQRLTPDGLATLASTWSYVAVSPRRDAILDAVRVLGIRVAGPDGLIVVPHRTRCFRARTVPLPAS